MSKFVFTDNPLKRIWHYFVRTVLINLVGIYWDLKVYNNFVVPQEGPVLLLCNHQSFLDPILCHNYIRRPIVYVARDTLFKGFFGKFIASIYAIPIKRGSADIAAIKMVINVLKNGMPICLYPEGSRCEDGRIAEMKPGFSLMTRKTGAPIIPMVVEGMFDSWPRTRKFPKPGQVCLMYGEPISADHIKEIGDEQFSKELTDTLRTMQNQLREKMGKTPIEYKRVFKKALADNSEF